MADHHHREPAERLPVRPAQWLSRRRLLKATALAGSAAVMPQVKGSVNTVAASSFAQPTTSQTAEHHAPSPYDPAEWHPFMHGVASGDPTDTAVIVWTRVTPTPEAVPGSGLGDATQLTWQVALDEGFRDIVKEGLAVATAETDHTVQVDVTGLEPDTAYYYRFLGAGTYSRVGRTRTMASYGATPKRVRLAVVSCANFELGYFAAYRDIAERAQRGEVDVVVGMGDYIYEYASGDYNGAAKVIRTTLPTWETTRLEDYRSRYGHYRRDSALQDAHAAAPWIVTWDDHEFANDAWIGGAAEHDDEFEGDWGARRTAAMRAYLEWLPIRATSPSAGGHIYRTLQFGRLADLSMLDLRTYRNSEGILRDGRAADPDRTMMGAEQTEWLAKQLEDSAARWNLIGTSVMMAPLNMMDLEAGVAGVLREFVDAGDTAAAVNPDQWDGYPADRERLLDLLAARQPAGSPAGRAVFLTGDIHSEWAMRVEHAGRVVAGELVTSSVTAPNLDDYMGIGEDSVLAKGAEAHLRRANAHVRHVDVDAHGYMAVEVTWESVSARWHRVADLRRADSEVVPGPEVVYPRDF